MTVPKSPSTGCYESTGKGKNQVTAFVVTDTFTAGDQVVVRALVLDDKGLPIQNATVDIVVVSSSFLRVHQH